MVVTPEYAKRCFCIDISFEVELNIFRTVSFASDNAVGFRWAFRFCDCYVIFDRRNGVATSRLYFDIQATRKEQDQCIE